MHCLNSQEIRQRLAELNLRNPQPWQLAGDRLCKEFEFGTFQKAFAFMTHCAEAAENMNHHPEWCNVYNKVSVQLTTHSAGGLTRLDFELATIMDEMAKRS